MTPHLILLLGFLFVIIAFSIDSKQKTSVSFALWVPLIWYAICATRPVGVWANIIGIGGFGSSDPTSGSPLDRAFYGSLTLIGIYILSKRKVNWLIIRRRNAWLYIFVLYVLISIFWSDYPVVSIKRVIKIIGSIVMMLIVFTESNPLEAFSTIIRRCSFVHLPLSIIFIKFFRKLGVSWDYLGNAESWIGVSTSKNILGQVVMVSALLFLLHIIRNWGKKIIYIDFIYFFMALYLLKGSGDSISATSFSVFLLGLAILLLLPTMKYTLNRIKIFVILILLSISIPLYISIQNSLMLSSEGSVLDGLFHFVGRDMTFTGRTEFWSEILEVASANPILGVGYGAFWIGRLVNVPFSDRMTSWYLGQAHNGYIDLFLQLGFVGVFLFAVVIYIAYKNILTDFAINFDYARLSTMLLCMILLLNVTESVFLRGDHHLWFIFLFTILKYPTNSNSITTKGKHMLLRSRHSWCTSR
ncbi:MAG: O-antigen ligase family protein [Colwellia sp.]|nr:O-antigen ligase family protein [Colwellia sp.]